MKQDAEEAITVPSRPIDWALLTAPLEDDEIEWLQKGKVFQAADSLLYCYFVPYVKAQSVRLRLDTIIPGLWNYGCEVIPHSMGQPVPISDPFAVLGTLVITDGALDYRRVSRQSIGTGEDYKAAETDAFKRAAQRLGIGNELHSVGSLTVPMEGAWKGAKALVDPKLIYMRLKDPDKYPAPRVATPQAPPVALAPKVSPVASEQTEGERACPTCDGPMLDKRATKTKSTQPDFKCKDSSCGGVIWPPRVVKPPTQVAAAAPAPTVQQMDQEKDDLPF